ncbi:VanZ family protein [Crossiella sp. CA-258035]|uniref:VanZ family protein n=1 Tax=Crossiella sp. CA-258035 TaxID=2981138 RepID=UPI0024BD3C4C|nr:VanZ family protein [Crossiella sp. CA-258035]WHT23091.1 VanZ family protein [Crossiella sp. CA-258035]
MISTRLLPAVLAVIGGIVLAVLLLAPFVYRSYRRRGELGLGHALLAFGSLVYALALVAYTLFPVPQLDDAWCAAHAAATQPQLNPLRFLTDIAKEQRAPGLTGLLTNPAVQQLLFNVALFVPLGAYLRHYLRRNALVIILLGAAVSLLIECTQLTGNWFLFPCPYRLFDVDDLLTNTLGTAVGILCAPALHLFDRRRETNVELPRPVTTARRLLGMLVDLLSVLVLGGVLGTTANLVGHYGCDLWLAAHPWGNLLLTALTTWLPAILLLALPAFGSNAATLGQRAVRLRRTRPDGTAPGARIIPALLFGTFGYCLFTGLGHYAPAAASLANLLPVAALLFAWRPRSHPGFSGLISGLRVTDDRANPSAPPLPQSQLPHREGDTP